MAEHKPKVKCFISYAHAYDDYFDVFWDDLKAATGSLPSVEFVIWHDREIELGSNWHERIQEQVRKCNLAIFLVSDKFMTSSYIKQNEVDRLFERQRNDRNLLLVPLYFYQCQFQNWQVFDKNELFRPRGSEYGQPENEHICYANLLKFSYSNGIAIPEHNPQRSKFVQDFVTRLVKQLRPIIVDLKENPPLMHMELYIPRPEKEGEVLEALKRGSRLVTVHGFVGTGKTQLAIECANRAVKELGESFPDTCLIVQLDRVKTRTPEAVAEAIGTCLRLPQESCLPEGVEDYLRDREVLIVLDGYETAASAAVKEFIYQILRNARARLLVTGQVPVGGLAEQVISLSSGMTEAEGRELFIERVQMSRGGGWRPDTGESEKIEHIVHDTERWPQAIVWAAAWVKNKSVAEVASEIRQRLSSLGSPGFGVSPTDNLRSCLDWSLNLLDDTTRETFYLLTVFPGSFTRNSAKAVLNIDDFEAERKIDGLVDIDLVHMLESKNHYVSFRIYPFVRDHAHQRRVAEGNLAAIAKTKKRYMAYYTKELTARFSADPSGQSSGNILDDMDWMEVEWPNIYGCAEYAIASKSWKALTQIADPLLGFLLKRGHMQEVEQLFTSEGVTALLKRKVGETDNADAKATPRQQDQRKAKAKILNTLGVIYQFQRRWREANAKFRESLDSLTDRLDKARTLNSLGVVYQDEDPPEWQEARKCLQESERLCEELLRDIEEQKSKEKPEQPDVQHAIWDVSVEQATALANLGLVIEDPDEADRVLTKSEKIREDVGDNTGLAETYNNFGRLYQRRRNWKLAEKYFDKRRVILEEIGDMIGLARVHNSLGSVCRDASYQTPDPTRKLLYGKKAEEHFSDATRICCDTICDPGEKVQAEKNLISLYRSLQDFERAAMMLESHIKHQRDQAKPALLNELGYIYQCDNDWNKAEENYRKALELAMHYHNAVEVQAAKVNLDRLRAIVATLAEAGGAAEPATVTRQAQQNPPSILEEPPRSKADSLSADS